MPSGNNRIEVFPESSIMLLDYIENNPTGLPADSIYFQIAESYHSGNC